MYERSCGFKRQSGCDISINYQGSQGNGKVVCLCVEVHKEGTLSEYGHRGGRESEVYVKNGMVSDKSYVLHLFAGSGGGVLGSILLGEEIVGAVEWEKYPRETLLARQRDGILPEFPIWDDVTTFRLDNPETEEYIRFLIGIRENLTIAGGFPCQDISIAGKGAGIEGSRSGLWGEMCRIIAEIRPRYILLENSPMLIVRGFERVITDLAKIRYCLAWSVMGASDVGANHQRDRFWGLGIAEEYLDRERDSHSDSDSDRCIRLVRGGAKL